jgi:hypothetical protein
MNGLGFATQWHGICGRQVVEITASKINEWVQVDRQRKIRAERRSNFFDHVRHGVRRIFIFLFIATIGVVAFNHRVEIQGAALAKLHAELRKSYASNSLRQNALNYEKQIDEIVTK